MDSANVACNSACPQASAAVVEQLTLCCKPWKDQALLQALLHM